MKRISKKILLAAGFVLMLHPAIAIGLDETGPVQNDASKAVSTDDLDSADSSDADTREFVLRYQFREGESFRYRSEKLERLNITVGVGNLQTTHNHIE